MFIKLTRSINCSFIIFSLGAALSACGSSSSSSSSTVPGINYAHNLVFKNGTTLSTGYNAFGQLGNGSIDSRKVPGALSESYHFKGFATGGNHSVAFTDSGEVYSWGNNAYGQLGISESNNSSVPVKTDLGDLKVKAVAAGALHTLALGGDGSVWAWGWNKYGQLGNEAVSESPAQPAKVVFSNRSTNVRALAANGYNSMALANGTVWVWGLNGNGQLGYNSLEKQSSQIPLAVPELAGITAIASGSAFSYALASDTTVWAWGNNSNGQLGDGTVLDAPESGTDVPSGCVGVSSENAHLPVKVKTANSVLTNIVQVAAGYHHGLARLADDTVWAWGANVLGQLGNQAYGGNNCFAVQVRYENGAYLLAKDIRAFGSSSLAMTADGVWYAWGNNIYGQLGIGSNDTALYPLRMSGF